MFLVVAVVVVDGGGWLNWLLLVYYCICYFLYKGAVDIYMIEAKPIVGSSSSSSSSSSGIVPFVQYYSRSCFKW